MDEDADYYRILEIDDSADEYDEGRAGHNRETAAREAREAEQQQRNRQQQYDRQRRQQEYQRWQEEEQQREEQQQREEEARRQREEERQRDEQRRQDEKRQQDEQQRAWERHQAQEEAESQPDPGVGQPEHPKPTAPTPMSRLFESIRSNWTPTFWWWLLGFILVWIAWCLRGNSTPGEAPPASPLPAPLDEMLKELRIGPSLAEVQVGFTENHNLPYELQLMEHAVGRLINPLDHPSLVGKYWDYSADAVDGVIEVGSYDNKQPDNGQRGPHDIEDDRAQPRYATRDA
ncbi:hypothetical protein MRS44_005409 [Fusarium solani]|uniref:uncharacterized protein n=1 Tax=Fusarium solani TaxID=169388 RepID=UPI0032C3F139|nr:hypothetical protein MRS44_005409 [Fusarium solani]